MSKPRPGSRGEQIYEAFKAFHEANPLVWELFQKYTREAIAAGLKRYSADAILHRIRWHAMVETRGGDGFRINNNFSSYYARLFMRSFPQHSGFFEARVRTSDRRDAFEREPDTAAPDPEFR